MRFNLLVQSFAVDFAAVGFVVVVAVVGVVVAVVVAVVHLPVDIYCLKNRCDDHMYVRGDDGVHNVLVFHMELKPGNSSSNT